jgi:hypothetical protein
MLAHSLSKIIRFRTGMFILVGLTCLESFGQSSLELTNFSFLFLFLRNRGILCNFWAGSRRASFNHRSNRTNFSTGSFKQDWIRPYFCRRTFVVYLGRNCWHRFHFNKRDSGDAIFTNFRNFFRVQTPLANQL